jgi:hypothetical protein
MVERHFGKLCGVLALTAMFAAGCSKSAADYMKSGDAFAKEGKHREALIEYRNAVQRKPPTATPVSSWPRPTRNSVKCRRRSASTSAPPTC